MRTTDEITYTFREFNRDKPGEVVVECVNFAMTNSVGLSNPKVVQVDFREWCDDEWYADEEHKPVPEIKVTVVGS